MARQSRAPVILLTRPEAQSARFAANLHAKHPGLEIVLSPLLVPRFFSPAIPSAARALILTSETGAEAARRLLAEGRPLPRLAFCVGARTAAAARAAGFEAISADGDVEALLALILAQRPNAPLLHLHGRDTRGDLAKRLNSAGIETFSAVVYEQTLHPLSARAEALLHGEAPVIAPLFSPRSAQALAAECARLGVLAPLCPVAISATAAAYFSGYDVTLAARPDGAAMLAAISSRLASLNLPPMRH